MLRIARLYASSHAVAEEIVQDTWVRVLGAIDAFEGRSSLRTWIFAILENCARRRMEREGRSLPFAALDARAPIVEPTRFFPPDHPRWAGMWTTLVDSWRDKPQDYLESNETRAAIIEAIRALPPNYATVFVLRDVEGWPSGEVCELLGISAENQRVLLHRARNRVRASLEAEFGANR